MDIESSSTDLVNTVNNSKGKPLGAFEIALTLLILAFLVQTSAVAYNSFQMKRTLEEEALQHAVIVSSNKKARSQLIALAEKTVELAERGNKNAAVIVEKFKAAGVNLKAPTLSKE